MPQTIETVSRPKPRGKPIRQNKLQLETELRLIRMLKKEMKKKGEAISEESLREQGLSQPFIKRFLSA